MCAEQSNIYDFVVYGKALFSFLVFRQRNMSGVVVCARLSFFLVVVV